MAALDDVRQRMTARRQEQGLPVYMTQTPQPMAAPQQTPTYSPPVTASNYFSDPLMQGYVDTSRHALSQLSRPTQMPQQSQALTSAIASLSQLLNAGDPGFDYFRPIAERRMAELDQPGYTHGQLDQIRTQYNDPLTAQRDAARQNVIQRFASQGITPESGIVQQALLDLDRTYAQETTRGDTQLAMHAADQDEARRQERVAVGAQAAGMAGQSLPVRASAANALAGIGQNEMAMDFQRQQLDTDKLLQAVGISQSLGSLPIQLQAQVLASLNALQGPTPQYSDPSISALLSLMGLGENTANQNAQRTSDVWSSILGMVPSIIGAFSGNKK